VVNASPLLGRPGAVAADAPDADVAGHYGDPFREQRALASGPAFVDRSHRGVVVVTGADRLAWLHSLTTQHFEQLRAGEAVEALVLSPTGHVEHQMDALDDGERTWLLVEPATSEPLTEWLASMRFMLRVEVRDATADLATITVSGDLDTLLESLQVSDGAPGPTTRQTFWFAATSSTVSLPSSRAMDLPRPDTTRSKRPGSRQGRLGCTSTPTPAASRTRRVGWPAASTSQRVATAARRPWPECTTWVVPPAASRCCTLTVPDTCYPRVVPMSPTPPARSSAR